MPQTASIIDYPRNALDESIWQINGEELQLQPNIKDEIADIVGSFLDDLDLPEDAILDVLIYGSMLTNQYNSSTDLDARILLDPEVVEQHYPGMTGDALYDVTKDTVHGVLLGDTKHPFNATVVVEGEETELGRSPLGISDRDPVYSIKEEKVIHEGIGYDESFDPDVEFMEERSEVKDVMTKLDSLVQDAKTDTIDIEMLKEAIGNVSDSEGLIAKIEDRLEDLNYTIEKMVDEYNRIKEERSTSYKEGPEDNRHKAPGNIRFKFLEKYRYMDMLKKMKSLFKDGIDPSELDDVAETLNVKAFPYRQPGPPETITAPPTMTTGPAAPSSIDTGRIDEGGMLAQPRQGATCPRCNHVNPMTATDSNKVTCEKCGREFETEASFSMSTSPSTPNETTPYASDFQLYSQMMSPQIVEDLIRLLQDSGISDEALKLFEQQLKGDPLEELENRPELPEEPQEPQEPGQLAPLPDQPDTGVKPVLKPLKPMNEIQPPQANVIADIKTCHLLFGATLMENLIEKLNRVKADSTGGTGGTFGEPPGKNPGDDPYSSGGGALAEYGTEGEPDDDKKKKKKREPDDDIVLEMITVLEGIDILPFLEDEALLEELLAAFPLLGDPSQNIDRIVGLLTTPPEGTGQYMPPQNPDYDTGPKRRKKKRREQRREHSPVKEIVETGEAVGINWVDKYPSKYNAANNELKELVLEWLDANPDPDDDAVHALAEEIGMETDELEEVLYEIATEHTEMDEDETEPEEDDGLTEEIAIAVGDELGIDWEDSVFDAEQFLMGIKVELAEHGTANPETNITDDDILETAKIAWAHLKELPDYYTRLNEMENSADNVTDDEDSDAETDDSDTATDSDAAEEPTDSGGSVSGFNDGFPGKTGVNESVDVYFEDTLYDTPETIVEILAIAPASQVAQTNWKNPDKTHFEATLKNGNVYQVFVLNNGKWGWEKPMEDEHKTAAAYMTLCPNCQTIQKAPIEGEGVECPFCGKGWLESLEARDPAKYEEYKEQEGQESERLHERTREQRGVPRMGTRIDPKFRQQINAALRDAGMDGNGRFDKATQAYFIALDILNEYGLQPIDDNIGDRLTDADILTEEYQNNGRQTVELQTPDGESIDNTMLVFSYYQFLETGNYEILAMLS